MGSLCGRVREKFSFYVNSLAFCFIRTHICRFPLVFSLHATNLAFAKIPIGGHSVSAFAAWVAMLVLISVSLRHICGTIVPFEVLFNAILGLIFCDIVYGMIKFIPVKDKRTGQTKRWAIGM